MMIKDMPKIHCPFVRVEDEETNTYKVIDEINTDDDGNSYDWVFNDPRTMAIEKIDGTNVSVVIQNGQVTDVFNRTNRIPLMPTDTYHQRIIKGILNTLSRGYLDMLINGQYFGELVGPKINGNHHKLDDWLFVPFKTYAQKKLKYKSYGKYGTDFDSLESWFKDGLIPLFNARERRVQFSNCKHRFVEGIMFTHPEPEDIDTLPYAKLRYDMYPWYNGPSNH